MTFEQQILTLEIAIGVLSLGLVGAILLRHCFSDLHRLVMATSLWRWLFGVTSLAVAVLWGGGKTTNDLQNAGQPCGSGIQSVSAPNLRASSFSGSGHLYWRSTVNEQEFDDFNMRLAFPTNLVVSNLVFYGMRPGPSSVLFALTWPQLAARDDDYGISLFANWTLDGSPWLKVDTPFFWWSHRYLAGRLNWSDLVDEAVAEGLFPTNATSDTCFLRAAWYGDSDDDMLEDGDELYLYGTNPANPDTDNDGMRDGWEVNRGTSPSNPDTDGDGLLDGWECLYDYYGFDPLVSNADSVVEADWDQDGLSNILESRYGTDPWSDMSDLDELPDVWEIRYGLDPLSEEGDDGDGGDPDHDGLSNYDEYDRGTDPSNPDTDGDGLLDSSDPHPLVADGDYFGLSQTLPASANVDAYYWIDLVVESNALVRFVGDAPSDLADPSFMAKGGVTNRVQLLIGKTYRVLSGHDMEVVGSSDPSVQVDCSDCKSLSVCWPVVIRALEGNGASFRMVVSPAGLGGDFVWTSHCCPITRVGFEFWYAHDPWCPCTGCLATGAYRYEGYAKSCEGGWCCCPDHGGLYEPTEDDGPYASGASVSFDKSAVIFEDAYTNMPGVVVARRSTQTTLTCVAHGGETGGTATFSIENGSRLVSCSGGSLPVTRFVPPQQKVEFEIVYEGLLPSDSEEDIVAKADFTERGTGIRHPTDEDELTSVKVELEAKYPAFANPDKHRHLYGVAETVYCHSFPSSSDGSWSVQINGDTAYRPQKIANAFYASWTNGVGTVEFSLGSATYQTGIGVLEPYVEVRNPRANETNFVFAIGESGHLLLYLDQYAAPYYVSFREIYMMEIPDESDNCSHTGYYTNRLTGAWSHASLQGAGNWNPVADSGYWGVDMAGTPDSYPEPWSEGEKIWNIPVGWGFGGGEVVGRVSNPTTQKFTIHEDGRFRIEKYDHWAERNIYGLIWLDGHLVLWPW